jgi:hypothetical protein
MDRTAGSAGADSSVGRATGYGLRDRGPGVRFPAEGAGNLSLLHRVQTDAGANPASYPLDAKGLFPRR